MNTKKLAKHRRRAPKPKINTRLDRKTNTNNIAAKRVTLLPGFLINGFTSGTTKKVQGHKVKKTKEHLLTENLHAFLEQKSNLRRSERILKRHNNSHTTTSPKTSLNNIFGNQTAHQPHIADSASSSPNFGPSDNLSFKSILKKNSKSIFKEISDKFSRVHIQNNSMVEPAIIPDDAITTTQLPISRYNENNNLGLDIHDVPSQIPPFTLMYNRSVCQDFAKKIRVNFKKNAIEECKEAIKTEINHTNMILEGKGHREETIVFATDDSDSEANNDTDMLPVPATNWVYYTPKNQKISVPALNECRLQPAVICANNNHHNLYEIKPKSNVVDFQDLDYNDNDCMMENLFFKKVAAFKKTPACLEPKRSTVDLSELTQHQGFQGTWCDTPEDVVEVGLETSCNAQLPFQPNILYHPPTTRMPTLDSYLDHYQLPDNILPETPGNPMFNGHGHEFTFLEDGNEYRIGESQPEMVKRHLSNEEEYILKRSKFDVDGIDRFDVDGIDRSEEPKMFNFNTQEMNMFNFATMRS